MKACASVNPCTHLTSSSIQRDAHGDPARGGVELYPHAGGVSASHTTPPGSVYSHAPHRRLVLVLITERVSPAPSGVLAARQSALAACRGSYHSLPTPSSSLLTPNSPPTPHVTPPVTGIAH